MFEKEIHPLDVALSHAINGQPDISEKILREQSQDDLRVLFNLGWHDLSKQKYLQQTLLVSIRYRGPD